MAKLLKKIGFQADVVCNGLEAVSVLQSCSYDVIFMDLQMPQMDGLQAARAIRHRWPCRSIRIIALTSCSQKGDREMCLQAGMDGYIAKPAKKEDILASLSRHD
jgi:CheY-like chemotaxis protein